MVRASHVPLARIALCSHDSLLFHALRFLVSSGSIHPIHPLTHSLARLYVRMSDDPMAVFFFFFFLVCFRPFSLPGVPPDPNSPSPSPQIPVPSARVGRWRWRRLALALASGLSRSMHCMLAYLALLTYLYIPNLYIHVRFP